MPPGGFFVPGSPVTGVVRYSIDEGTSIDEIIISLKGFGSLTVTKNQNSKQSTTYHSDEEYVYIATVVKIDEGEPESRSRQFETEFNFTLPHNIPSSVTYNKRQGSYKANCKISYNIRAKFVVSGRLSLNKKFSREIQVVSAAINPVQPMKPNIHGQRRKLFQPFRKVQSIVNIKATVQNSVILPGGKLEIAYEVQNNTNLVAKAVKTKLVEVYDFYAYKRHIVEMGHKVKDMESKTGTIKSRDCHKSSCEIMLPPDLHSIENSKLLKRDYIFLITVKMPVPYRNVTLRIPLQVGYPVATESMSGQVHQLIYPVKEENVSDEDRSTEAAGTSYDPPPSYWQSIKTIDSSSLVKDSEEKFDFSDDSEKINDSNDTNETTSKDGITSKETNNNKW